MRSVRRLSIAALVVACLHLVFGAIVRISGSGMGCGDHWPKCYGYWIPPFSRPDLIVEVSHRYLASILVLTVCSMAFVAFRHRRDEGVSGPGGVLRTAIGAVGAVFSAAILGGVTVKMGNAPWATVLHWLNAMTLLALVAATAIRAGALGGDGARKQHGTARAARSAFAAAMLAIFAVALGGLTAKIPGAAVACTTVPSCGRNASVDTAAVMVQMTHRTLAMLLVLHLLGMMMMLRKRRSEEAPVVVRAATIAFGMVILQLAVASSMVLFHLPPVLRSLHEATGVGIWLSCFALAYLARRVGRGASEDGRVGAGGVTPVVHVDAACHPERSEGSRREDGDPSVATLPQDDNAGIAMLAPVHNAGIATLAPVDTAEVTTLPQNEHVDADRHPQRSEGSLRDDGDPSVATLPQDDNADVTTLARVDNAENATLAQDVHVDADRHPERSEGSLRDDGDPSVATLPQDDNAGIAMLAQNDNAGIITLAPEKHAVIAAVASEEDTGAAAIVSHDTVTAPSVPDDVAPLRSPALSPISPLPLKHTMAVIVARGADL